MSDSKRMKNIALSKPPESINLMDMVESMTYAYALALRLPADKIADIQSYDSGFPVFGYFCPNCDRKSDEMVPAGQHEALAALGLEIGRPFIGDILQCPCGAVQPMGNMERRIIGLEPQPYHCDGEW